MFDFLTRLFKGKEPQSEFTEEQYAIDYDQKKAGLETVLGTMHNLVHHAIIPYAIGGPLDIYVFPNHIAGTGFVSMELLEPDGSGPAPNSDGTYELIMFTKREIDSEQLVPPSPESPFEKMVLRCRSLMTNTAFYGAASGEYAAVLNSLETSTIPISYDEIDENAYCFFRKYANFSVGNRKHHLLLIMEVFESEQDYARQEGTEKLLEKLKAKGYYPYSDLDREPVV